MNISPKETFRCQQTREERPSVVGHGEVQTQATAGSECQQDVGARAPRLARCRGAQDGMATVEDRLVGPQKTTNSCLVTSSCTRV